MDRATFEAKVSHIKKGDFLNDTTLRGYANDSFYEMRQMFDALWECCQWQSQRIGLLKKMNSDMENGIKHMMKERRELKQEIKELHEQIANMDALLLAKEQSEQEGDV